MKTSRWIATLERLGELAAKDGSSYPVFGQPITLGNQTIVPVSAVVIGFGGGAGGFPLLSGGGGGGDIRVFPIGFVRERDGDVVFTPIAIPEGLVRHAHEHREHAPRQPGWASRQWRRLLRT